MRFFLAAIVTLIVLLVSCDNNTSTMEDSKSNNTTNSENNQSNSNNALNNNNDTNANTSNNNNNSEEIYVFGPPIDKPQTTYLIDSITPASNPTYTLDAVALETLKTKITNKDFGNIDSLIIIQNGEIVIEDYFRGWNRHKLHYFYSVTKTLSAAIIGKAIEDGYISSINNTVIDYFDNYDTIESSSDYKDSITIEDVLTMSTGIEWNEQDVPYLLDTGIWNVENQLFKMYYQAEGGDWVKYILDQPITYEPGTKFVYNTASMMLISGILQNEIGKSAGAYMDEVVLAPLGITEYTLVSSDNGTTDLGGGLQMHPINMAMIGYLFLRSGNINGTQIIPAQWISDMSATHISVDDYRDYGYLFWKYKDNHVAQYYSGTNDIFYAAGFGGQKIIIIPHLDMVIVSTADNYFHEGPDVDNMFLEYILPAVVAL